MGLLRASKPLKSPKKQYFVQKYIGESDPVGPRLYSHYGNKDFRTETIVLPCFVRISFSITVSSFFILKFLLAIKDY